MHHLNFSQQLYWDRRVLRSSFYFVILVNGVINWKSWRLCLFCQFVLCDDPLKKSFLQRKHSDAILVISENVFTFICITEGGKNDLHTLLSAVAVLLSFILASIVTIERLDVLTDATYIFYHPCFTWRLCFIPWLWKFAALNFSLK